MSQLKQNLSLIRKYRELLLDFLFPRTCLRCGSLCARQGEIFTCAECQSHYLWIRDPVCERCGIPIYGEMAVVRECASCRDRPPILTHARSLLLYRETGARLVHALKYERGSWLFPEMVSLIRKAEHLAAFLDHACLVPIPLHPSKLRKRGYNQATVVAMAIQAAYPQSRICHALVKIRKTPSQTTLTREQRQENMRGAFALAGQIPSGRILLVDDVRTTGATLDAAAKALQKSHTGPISAFTLARG